MDEMRVDIVADSRPASTVQTRLRLHWQREDPLAVALTVLRQPEHPALPSGTWMMLRDFLRYGLEAPTGDGDVRVRPAPDGALTLELFSRRGRCLLSVPGGPVREFLDATEQVVPAGEERSDTAIDALIDQLLGRQDQDRDQ